MHAPRTSPELRLHATRDFVYGVLFLTLPFVRWSGAYAWVLAGLLALEVVITLVDFWIEEDVRATFGGVARGERAMHTIMAILYGAFLATLLPELLGDAAQHSGFVWHHELGWGWRALLASMGVGVLLSGLRDLAAANGWGVVALPLLNAGARPGDAAP